jgi:hypothetical protein
MIRSTHFYHPFSHLTSFFWVQKEAEYMYARETNTPLNPEVASVIKKLWADEVVRNAYKRRSEFQLADSAA